MASNYLFMTGWEMGSAAICDTVISDAPVTTAQKRTGAYSLNLTDKTDGIQIDLGSNYTTIYAGVAYCPDDDGYQSNGIMSVQNSEGEHKLFVGLTRDTYQLCVDCEGTSLAIGSTLTVGTWYYIEVKFVLDNVNGAVEVLLDGVSDISYSGDTHGSATPMDMRYVALGDPGAGAYPAYGAQGYYDDFMIATDGHVGRCGIELLTPTGAGTTTQLTPSAGDNYACVDEVPPNDGTDYVSSATVDKFDTYALGDLTQAGTVKAVQAFMRGALSEAGEGYIAPVLRSGGTDYTGDDMGLDVSYAYKRKLYNVDPKTGVAWVGANVNSAEFGPKVR